MRPLIVLDTAKHEYIRYVGNIPTHRMVFDGGFLFPWEVEGLRVTPPDAYRIRRQQSTMGEPPELA